MFIQKFDELLKTLDAATSTLQHALLNASRVLDVVFQLLFHVGENGFDHPDGSCFLHIEFGERMQLTHRDGVYVQDTGIAPVNKQVRPFAGQGRRT